jgi:hypothetical protein
MVLCVQQELEEYRSSSAWGEPLGGGWSEVPLRGPKLEGALHLYISHHGVILCIYMVYPMLTHLVLTEWARESPSLASLARPLTGNPPPPPLRDRNSLQTPLEFQRAKLEVQALC